jgi:hypothetical protein
MELPIGEEFFLICIGIFVAVVGVLVMVNIPGLSGVGISLILVGSILSVIALVLLLRNR